MARPKHSSHESVLDAINRWIADHGIPPTIEELRAVLGVGSTRTVLRYLQALEEDGAIERWKGARGLRPRRRPQRHPSTEAVPIVGRAPAGALMLAEQNVEGWIRLPREFVRPSARDYFLVRIRGNSMNQAEVSGNRIEDSDLILVRRQDEAKNGDVVVALLDGEVTVKRLSIANGYVVLRPVSSETHHDSFLLNAGFRIQGVVKRVFKRGSDILEREDEEPS
ncbi:MAG TPA: transcriptional repressor LexA [Terriglobales bacterium]|nr:transcriptional repressor LexA [Terriglobales bacterium]